MSALRSALAQTPLYPVARAAYRAIFKPERLAEAQRMRAFYSLFIPAGSTAFDVGGLYGEYAEMFLSCGAGKVVTFEPNANFAGRLRALSRRTGGRIVPEMVALSDREGAATLNVCREKPGYSTLTRLGQADWMTDNPDYKDVTWEWGVAVTRRPIAAYIDRYGLPAFVKIDVEGHELEVLKGLEPAKGLPDTISFEFGARRKETPLACIRLLAEHGYRAFRPMVGREYAYAAPMMGPDEAIRWLEAYPIERGEYGDMFCGLFGLAEERA